MILTSNEHVRAWPEAFGGDEALTTVVLNRLLHQAHVVSIQGRSHRSCALDDLLRHAPAKRDPPIRWRTTN